MTSDSLKHVLIGPIYHSLSPSEFVYEECVALCILESGIIGDIVKMKSGVTMEEVKGVLSKSFELSNAKLSMLSKSQFIIPGFIDTHIHGPQYVFTGTGYDLNLLDWLNKYTFPREAAFKSTDYAKKAYSRVISQTLKAGTTTACYYATTHVESCKVMADLVHEKGQRAFIGKVNMDRNSPDFYIETTEESIKDTKEFIRYVREEIKSSRITPVLTPRFVPSCTVELMKALADISKEHNLPIQSHISESEGEIDWVAQLHPEAETYTDTYDLYGLLNERTIMAHCIHLNAKEREKFLDKKVGISHCASSNFCLHSGVLNVRRLFEEGFEKVGLGTDVAGGYSSSILDSMRQSIIASKVIHVSSRDGNLIPEDKETTHVTKKTKRVYDPLSYSEAFYLATLGGAKVMNLDDKIGNFVKGKEFDALVVDISPKMVGENDETKESTIDVFDHDDAYSILEKFVYLGDDRNIISVYVGGRHVLSK